MYGWTATGSRARRRRSRYAYGTGRRSLPPARSPRHRSGSPATTFWTATVSRRPSRSPPSTRWPATASSRSGRSRPTESPQLDRVARRRTALVVVEVGVRLVEHRQPPRPRPQSRPAVRRPGRGGALVQPQIPPAGGLPQRRDRAGAAVRPGQSRGTFLERPAYVVGPPRVVPRLDRNPGRRGELRQAGVEQP